MAQHRRPQEAKQQDAVTRAAPEPRPQPTVSVGDQLRVARERRGQGIFEIADILRIKADFLNALERGAYDRLPADAYVVGFLRSYAEYLGLDSVALRAAYRQEISGRAKMPQLSMPQPLPEGKTPHLLLILGGILLAIMIYATWYFSIAHDRAVVAPPPLPPSSKVDAPALPPPATPTTPLPLPGTGTPHAATTTGAPLVGTPSNGSPAAITLTTTPAQVEAHTPLTRVAAEPVTEPESAAVSGPGQNIDKTDKPTRVTIRATRENAITVTDAKGKPIFSHVLAAGDMYHVPDQPGLKLTTANAGTLVIAVDGKELPKLGNPGQVARDIGLDPAILVPKEP